MPEVNIEELTNLLLPAGMIIPYAGNGVPPGWALCNGALVDKNSLAYARLYLAIGDLWGGDGKDMFRLPDLRGRFLRGVDYGAGNDPSERQDIRDAKNASMYTVATVQQHATAMPTLRFRTSENGNHAHSVRATHNNGGGSGHPLGDGDGAEGAYSHSTSTQGDHRHEVEGGDVETRPTNVAVSWLIKL